MTVFHATEEQHELIESFSRPLEEMFAIARLHKDMAADDAQWCAAAELGWFGISLPEEMGGIGLTVVEEALLFTQLGKHLATPGFMAASLAAKVAAGAGDAALAQHILSGDLPVGIARAGAGADVTLFDAQNAAVVLVLSAEGAALYKAEALTARRLLDAAQWSLALEAATLTGTPLAVLGSAKIDPDVQLLAAAQLTGIAAATLDMAVAYAQIRQQFGAAIGSFQAIKHYCTDMAMQLLAAKDSVSFAAVALAEGYQDARFQVASALVVAIRAALHNVGKNIQIHGGMGFSAECDAHLFLKRAHVLETLAGGLKSAHAALAAESSVFGKDAA